MSFERINPADSTAVERLLFPCIIDARWSPGSLIYQPVVYNTVLSNIFDTSRLEYSKYALGKPIQIDISYAHSLNSVLSDFTLDNLSYTVFEHNLRYFYSHDGISDWKMGEGTWQWMLSTMLSLQFAEALSSNSAGADGVIWIDKLDKPWTFCRNYNWDDWTQSHNSSHVFVSPAAARLNSEKWTEIKWKTEQYVYSWSLRQTPSFIAFAVIGLHAAIVLSYVLYTTFKYLFGAGKRQCYACKDILALVTLAFQSPATPPIESEPLGSRSRAHFAQPVRLIEGEHGKGLIITLGEEVGSDDD